VKRAWEHVPYLALADHDGPVVPAAGLTSMMAVARMATRFMVLAVWLSLLG